MFFFVEVEMAPLIWNIFFFFSQSKRLPSSEHFFLSQLKKAPLIWNLSFSVQVKNAPLGSSYHCEKELDSAGCNNLLTNQPFPWFHDGEKETFELKPYMQIYQNKDLLFLKFSKQVSLNVVSELNG